MNNQIKNENQKFLNMLKLLEIDIKHFPLCIDKDLEIFNKEQLSHFQNRMIDYYKYVDNLILEKIDKIQKKIGE